MIIVLRIQSIKFLLSVNNNTSFANEGSWVELNTFRKFREPRNPANYTTALFQDKLLYSWCSLFQDNKCKLFCAAYASSGQHKQYLTADVCYCRTISTCGGLRACCVRPVATPAPSPPTGEMHPLIPRLPFRAPMAVTTSSRAPGEIFPPVCVC